MKKIIICYIATLIGVYSMQISAAESQEQIYLIQIKNQINALKPLILAAEREQPKNLRIKFHYSHFHDSSGKLHNGLLEDINEIEKAVNENLIRISHEPRRFTTIKDDYVD